MLVITRKPNEVISLSNGIRISIEGIDGNRVKIGIEAPKHIGIARSEPCRCCKRPTFDYYLGYKDLPFCGRMECEQSIKDDKSLFP
jgi:carbon storage regulator CsrA